MTLDFLEFGIFDLSFVSKTTLYFFFGLRSTKNSEEESASNGEFVQCNDFPSLSDQGDQEVPIALANGDASDDSSEDSGDNKASEK